MDIKLIKNFEEGTYTPVNKDLMLQIIDDNYQLQQFRGKKIFMFNPVTNERYEILPEIKKYDIAEFYYASAAYDYFIFTSAEQISETEIKILYYWYSIEDGEAKLIHIQNEKIEELGKTLELKTFILDESHCIFERNLYRDRKKAVQSLLSKGKADHELILYDMDNEKELQIHNAVLVQSGIDKIISLNGNICAIKLGGTLIEERLYDNTSLDEESDEIIALVNVKQFISDIALQLDNIYMDVLDRGTKTITFPYIRQYDNNIVYSRVDAEKKIEEVIIYDYENKIKKVRLNSNITRVSDLSHTYVINSVPYMIKNTDKATRLINLNTQKTEMKLNAETRIKYIKNDLIITQRHVKKMFFMRKENNYVEVFRYPDMHHPIFRTRAKYKNCVIYYDDILIFTN
jgi:hypothetical protein